MVVYTAPDVGTTFKVYWPRGEGGLAGQVQQDIVPRILRGQETVLVVEDDDILRKLAYRSLCVQGYNVLEAALPSEAVRISSSTMAPSRC